MCTFLVAIVVCVLTPIFLFRSFLEAIHKLRSDNLDVLLTQKEAFAQTLDHIRQTQHVQGIPLQLALAQHESQTEAARENAQHNYELAKADIEARRASPMGRPRPVPVDHAMGS